MTTTQNEAVEAIFIHHRALDEQLKTRVATLERTVAGGGPHDRAAADLLAYLATEVLPHAEAEEHTIYLAATETGLAATVREMIAEHRELSAATERLADAQDGDRAAEEAKQIASLFSAHVGKENLTLLPGLLDQGGVDLAGLLTQMHQRTEDARQAASGEDASTKDAQSVVVSLLVEAATDLARAGEADRACRLTASAWAALHSSRPELARRLTSALHRLTTLGSLTLTPAAAGGGQAQTADPDLDVRSLAPAQRHETIFTAYHALSPGTGFVLINDHDPKPLRYQFEAEHAGEFTWDSIEAGPTVWRVRIGRGAQGAGAPGQTTGGATSPEESEPVLDVRSLAHGRRHETIFTAYHALAPGAGFVLVNDHDPLPLRYQFEAQHAGEHTWDYLEEGPKVWRVRIGRAVAAQ